MKFSKILLSCAALGMLVACGPTTSTSEATSVTPAEHNFTFNYNYEGAPAPKVVKVKHGEKVTPEKPEREGFKFDAWYTTEAMVNKFNFEKEITKDYSVFAGWKSATVAEVWSVVGGFGGENEWNKDSEAYVFTTEDFTNYSIELDIAEGTPFKVIKDHSWDVQKDATKVDAENSDAANFDLVSDTKDHNIKCLVNGKYKISFSVEGEGLMTIKKTGDYIPPKPPVDAENYKLHIAAPADWENVNLWAWNEAGNHPTTDAWPGVALTKGDDGLYSYELGVSFVNLIVNNGTVQTADIKLEKAEECWVTVTTAGEDGKFGSTVSYTAPVGTLAECTFSKAIPEGWTYIPNNTDYPDAGFYKDGGLKVNYVGIGITTSAFAASSKATVTLTVNALNENTKTEAGGEHVFTITGLNEAGEVVATSYLDELVVGANAEVVLEGTAIVKVSVVMTAYFNNGTKFCNVNLGGVLVK